MNKPTVLLINLGTPSTYKLKDVGIFLFRFLNDKRVIDLNKILRFLLVNLIIIPFRVKKSSLLYKKLWTKEGSPLLVNSIRAQKRLQRKLPTYKIELAMSYSKPDINTVLSRIKDNTDNLIILPLYPQYASSTSGSIIESTMSIIQKWNNIPNVHYVKDFYNNEKFTQAIVSNVNKYNLSDYDFIVFTYHGLPERHIKRSHNGEDCNTLGCTEGVNKDNKFCYRASCYQTSKNIAKELGLSTTNYTTVFQSRLGKDWIRPYCDETLIAMAKGGYKNILVISPSFVSDCLETSIEIGYEYKEYFLQAGGTNLDLVESLNYSDKWIDCLSDIIKKAPN